MTANPLLAALADFQAKPPTLTKNKAGHQSKYADLVQVNEQVLNRLNELGIVYTCAPTLDDDGKFVLAYELTHVESGGKLAGRYPLKLAENPQQMGSAITYARRYVLLALTGVAAEDEDDDGQAASGRRIAQRAPQARREPAAAAPERNTAQRAQRPAGPPLPGEDGNGITPRQQSLLHVLLGKAGKSNREAGLGYISDVLEREITSTKELSKTDANRVIDHLQAAVEKQEQPA
ncbi:ERF family protein [Micromonospora aurantiaca (nom. illeg.)]|uniref:ERF family protein n=1 Tax=Micromonospora aurantiaca (nom. illeg.) TaxID=47850 RepID=UPI003EBEAFEC